MWTIAKKEILLFFSNPSGYLIIALFLVLNSLLFWVFNTDFNVLQSGFGDMSLFFDVAPWLFIFLIPALAMRSFVDEIRIGTIELLLTKPIRLPHIILGKFTGVFLLALIALAATGINLIGVTKLLEKNSQMDWGIVGAAYLTLLLVLCIFIAIGLCCSLLFKNTLSALFMAILICYCHFGFWEQLAKLTTHPFLFDTLNEIGIREHYERMRKGTIGFSDMIYFIACISFYLFWAMQLLKKLKQ